MAAKKSTSGVTKSSISGKFVRTTTVDRHPEALFREAGLFLARIGRVEEGSGVIVS